MNREFDRKYQVIGGRLLLHVHHHAYVRAFPRINCDSYFQPSANGKFEKSFFLLFSKTNYPHLKTAYQLSRFSIIVKTGSFHSRKLCILTPQVSTNPYFSVYAPLSQVSKQTHCARRTFSFSLSLFTKKISVLSILNDFSFLFCNY